MLKSLIPLFVLLLLLGNPSGFSQHITHGPVFGAVTSHSARCYLGSNKAGVIRLQISKEEDFREFTEYSLPVTAAQYYSTIAELDSLEADQEYFCRFFFNDSIERLRGRFRTFPEEGSEGIYSFVTGSCQETPNMKVFDVIASAHDPYFFLHTGDYTYPDYQIAPDYSSNDSLLELSYRKRYDEKRMKELLYSLPIDYVYDDNDYVGASGGKYYKNYNRSEGKIIRAEHRIWAEPFPSFWRTNCIRAYTEFFPAYPLPDTSEGIYHRFAFGNADFFFLDRNSCKPHPNAYAFRYDEEEGRWAFDPPEDHVLYGPAQMQWLKEQLLASEADWKFIVSGVPFNPSLRRVIETGIAHQNQGWQDNTGFRIAAGFAHYWAGHPAEQADFFDFIEANHIEDVIFISGDTHHNVMDNGENSYFPELNASGLSVAGTHLAKAMQLTGQLVMGFNYKKEVWNVGGNGLGNYNFKNAFGKVTIYGREYVLLEIIDEDNKRISTLKVQHSSGAD